MNVTGNQAVQLLWVHEFDPCSPLELKDTEVKHLQVEMISKFDSLDLKNHYVKQLMTHDKNEMCDLLTQDKTIFQGD